jgi:hypothetical protein
MSPIVEGKVEYLSSENTRIEQLLTQNQMQSLTAWLVSNSSKWHRCFATPPGGTPIISLQHANGTSSSLTLLKYPNTISQTTLLARYLSGSNLSDQPSALQSFSRTDIDFLRALLGVPQ